MTVLSPANADSGLAMLQRRLDAVDESVRRGADEADRCATFPADAFSALQANQLVSALAPVEYGGLALEVDELIFVARRLARGCGATAMIWAMHQAQVASVLAGVPAGAAAELLREVTRSQKLIASVTSEVNIGGDIRSSSAAAVRVAPGVVRIVKEAPTISYARYAHAFLVTCRRDRESAPNDQVAALVPASLTTLTPGAFEWDPMGMRATVSPGFTLSAQFADDHLLPEPFALIASRAMVPYAHSLWAACWYGLAEEALSRARSVARKRDSQGGDPRLGEAMREIMALDALLTQAAERCPAIGDELPPGDIAWFNDLKITASELTVSVATRCLEVCGMSGFQERTPHSVARILRDLLSARLMIGNDRLRETNARYALVRGS